MKQGIILQKAKKSGYVFLTEDIEYIHFLDKEGGVTFEHESTAVEKKLDGENISSVEKYLVEYLISQAKNNRKGQFLLCYGYTDYMLYIESGVFNIQGKGFSKLRDQEILSWIKKLNSERISVKRFFILINTPERSVKIIPI